MGHGASFVASVIVRTVMVCVDEETVILGGKIYRAGFIVPPIRPVSMKEG